MTLQQGYCQYLREWADTHNGVGFQGMTPVCYDEWLQEECIEDGYADVSAPPAAHSANEIAAIRDKTGDPAFRMALSHLFDIGFRNITEESIVECKEMIIATEETGTPIMTKEFQCRLLDVALELTRFSIWDLLYFVRTQVYIG